MYDKVSGTGASASEAHRRGNEVVDVVAVLDSRVPAAGGVLVPAPAAELAVHEAAARPEDVGRQQVFVSQLWRGVLLAQRTGPRGAKGKRCTWKRMQPSAHKSDASMASSSLSTSGETYSVVPAKRVCGTSEPSCRAANGVEGGG